MKLKYYKQETKYTCGPAAMRMVLESLGIKRTEKQLTKQLKTSKKSGTQNKRFSEIAQKYKLNYITKFDTKITEIRKLQKQKYRIIVDYKDSKEKIGHYAIIKKITSKKIYLLDPWNGPNYLITMEYFKKNWKSEQEKQKAWIIAIKK